MYRPKYWSCVVWACNSIYGIVSNTVSKEVTESNETGSPPRPFLHTYLLRRSVNTQNNQRTHLQHKFTSLSLTRCQLGYLYKCTRAVFSRLNANKKTIIHLYNNNTSSERTDTYTLVSCAGVRLYTPFHKRMRAAILDLLPVAFFPSIHIPNFFSFLPPCI